MPRSGTAVKQRFTSMPRSGTAVKQRFTSMPRSGTAVKQHNREALLIAIEISGCRETWDNYNPRAPTPEAAFNQLWPCDQAKWLNRAKSIVEK